MSDEVVFCGVLLQTPEQVADGYIEILGVDDRCVEKQCRLPFACEAFSNEPSVGRRHPLGISNSTRSATPRLSASSLAKAMSNRLWLATPILTALNR